MKILIVNGPNINFLGIRDKNQYGDKTYEQLCDIIKEKAKSLGFETEIFQSNTEGLIIDKLQEVYTEGVSAVIINPGAFTHYSYAIRDCLECFSCPKIEVHISNIHKREKFRHKSVTASVCDAQIAGMGLLGYTFALEYVFRMIENQI